LIPEISKKIDLLQVESLQQVMAYKIIS
jgi:hypothetical protein